MFDNLLISNPKKQGMGTGASSAMTSATLHGAIIWAAIAATVVSEQIIEDVEDDTTMIFIQEEEQVEEELPPELEIELPPQGFLALSAPINIPTEIPPIDLTQTFDPRNFSGVGVEGGVFSGVIGGQGPIDLTQTFLEAVVDERPERLSGPVPRYPEMLRQAGVEGVVMLEFVIDTTGRVEEENVKILHSTNRAFEAPARNVIVRSLYRPGRVRGVAVRVLVQQQIGFSIQREDE
jgi:protein TonB